MRNRPSDQTGHRNGAHSVGAGEVICCAWDDCEKRGLLLYEARVEYGSRPEVYSHRARHLFCSERHKQYWINGHRSYGNLPGGMRGVIR